MTDLYVQWMKPFFQSLIAAGVTRVVISPGSRSTPLTLTALRESSLHCDVVVDERCAAFLALGQVRATGMPTVLICTSGSAGAHYYPAIIEASQSHLPLIVITADRPWELQQCGANQTIDQQKLYGAHVKKFFELGEPASDVATPQTVQRIASQAVYCALSPAPGPVHINARFRKPLEPEESVADVKATAGFPTLFVPPQATVPPHGIQKLTALCRTFRHGLIVCGPGPLLSDAKERSAAVAAFAAASGYPVVAETASGLRCRRKMFLENATACFSADVFSANLPDFIIEIHRPLTAAAYERFINGHPAIPRVVLSEDEYVDVSGTANLILSGNITDALTQASATCSDAAQTGWAQNVLLLDRKISTLRTTFLDSEPFCDGTAVAEVVHSLCAEATLCLGNSMAIRDTDLFASPIQEVRVSHQRGASGIDGLVSGAVGTASCLETPVVALVGDISSLHDLGGFAALKHAVGPLVLIILNNNGGQIFSQLPLAQVPGIEVLLQEGFVVPGTPSFEGICGMFGLDYHLVQNKNELRTLVETAQQESKVTVIEVQLQGKSAFRQQFVELVRSQVSGAALL